jgi:RND family efflux transporter MFP subunit
MGENRFLKTGLIIWMVFFLGGCAEEQVPEEVIRNVRATKIADPHAFDGRTFPGRAKAHNEVNVAFEVRGRVADRPVDVGTKVTAGQLLVALDPRDYQNSLEEAIAARRQAKTYRDRIAGAVDSGAVSKQDLTDAQARYDITVAEVKIREKALEDTILNAPFDGTVAAIYVENYEQIRAKQVVMRLLDTARMEMIIDIPEDRIAYAQYVKEIKVRFDAIPDREIPSEILEISNEASLATRTYPVTLIMDNPPDLDIKPGMAGEATATLDLPPELKDTGYVVPPGAVVRASAAQEGSYDSYVWVIDEQSKTVAKRVVVPGRLTPHGLLIREGLKPGEWIAVAGANYLREGQKVVILDAGAKSSGQTVKIKGPGITAGEATELKTGGAR